MSADRIFALIRLGFLLIGAVFLCISWGMSRSFSHKKSVCTLPVRGRIVDVVESSTYHIDSVSSVTWYPVYEYSAGGQTIRRRSVVGGEKHKYTVGKQVTLMVNPQNIEECYNPEDPMGFLVKIFLIVGCVLVAAGITTGLVGKFLFHF